MVMIEPRTEEKQEKIVHKETISVTAETPEKEKTDYKQVTIEASANILEGFKRLINKIKEQGFNLTTFGMPPQKKANHYCKLCWNYMARNEVDKAKKNYDKLVSTYESLEEGPNKTDLYQEVYDIYSRLAEVK